MAEQPAAEQEPERGKEQAAQKAARGADDEIALQAIAAVGHDLIGQPADDGTASHPHNKNRKIHGVPSCSTAPSLRQRRTGFSGTRANGGGTIDVFTFSGKLLKEQRSRPSDPLPVDDATFTARSVGADPSR